jgi:hypothetical protein
MITSTMVSLKKTLMPYCPFARVATPSVSTNDYPYFHGMTINIQTFLQHLRFWVHLLKISPVTTWYLKTFKLYKKMYKVLHFIGYCITFDIENVRRTLMDIHNAKYFKSPSPLWKAFLLVYCLEWARLTPKSICTNQVKCIIYGNFNEIL